MALRLPWLDENSLDFPPLDSALRHPDGLLAAGGDLSTPRLLEAYRRGIFPWYSEGEPILWWSPDPRTVIFPGQLHRSRSLDKFLKHQPFTYSRNQAFNEVMAACAAPRAGQQGTWITAEMSQAYGALHRQGHAQSLECWQDGILVGGIYGVVIGKCFFGESMFSRAPNASKAALVALDEHLLEQGFLLLDCQVSSPHLLSMGAREIPRREFVRWLERGIHG